ncbi:MAG: hypothetical protein ACJAV1_002002 [Paraglaciecola sp.]|jgi:hypothetical protein
MKTVFYIFTNLPIYQFTNLLIYFDYNDLSLDIKNPHNGGLVTNLRYKFTH